MIFSISLAKYKRNIVTIHTVCITF